jgi:hypothetical protein
LAIILQGDTRRFRNRYSINVFSRLGGTSVPSMSSRMIRDRSGLLFLYEFDAFDDDREAAG